MSFHTSRTYGAFLILTIVPKHLLGLISIVFGCLSNCILIVADTVTIKVVLSIYAIVSTLSPDASPI